MCRGDLVRRRLQLDPAPSKLLSESLERKPLAPYVAVAERRVMDVDFKFINDVLALVLTQEVGGSSQLEFWEEETPDELSQTKFALLNERHCLNGDGAEKLKFDFCGDRLLSLERLAKKSSASDTTPSSDKSSFFKSSILSEIEDQHMSNAL